MISVSELSNSNSFTYKLFVGDEKDIAKFFCMPVEYSDKLQPLLKAKNLVLHKYEHHRICAEDEVFFYNYASIENGDIYSMISKAVIETERFILAGDFSDLPDRILGFVQKTVYVYLFVKRLNDLEDTHYVMSVYLGMDKKYLNYYRKNVIDGFLESLTENENI